VPELANKLEYYTGESPIFDLYDVENEIQRALERKVELKSGGYLIIDQTEAMTTVDINTGAFVGHRNLEETIFNTNVEATAAIARHLRLRNLGGIIIIDFIDMQSEDHRRRVLHSLELALAKDRAKTNVNGFSQLGLVEMTRKRTRESLEHVLCAECPECKGRGRVKTVESVCFEILREIIRVNRAYDADQFTVYAAPSVADYLRGGVPQSGGAGSLHRQAGQGGLRAALWAGTVRCGDDVIGLSLAESGLVGPRSLLRAAGRSGQRGTTGRPLLNQHRRP
jgi:ribonuclease G